MVDREYGRAASIPLQDGRLAGNHCEAAIRPARQEEAYRKLITTTEAPPPAGHYSQAVVHGNTVYVSGLLPIDPVTRTVIRGGIEDQMDRVLMNLKAILSAAGSGLSGVVKTTVYVTSIDLWPRVNVVYSSVFGEHRPARCVVPVGALRDGALVELEAIAELS